MLDSITRVSRRCTGSNPIDIGHVGEAIILVEKTSADGQSGLDGGEIWRFRSIRSKYLIYLVHSR
jgi:hypothetical protein